MGTAEGEWISHAGQHAHTRCDIHARGHALIRRCGPSRRGGRCWSNARVSREGPEGGRFCRRCLSAGLRGEPVQSLDQRRIPQLPHDSHRRRPRLQSPTVWRRFENLNLRKKLACAASCLMPTSASGMASSSGSRACRRRRCLAKGRRSSLLATTTATIANSQKTLQRR